MPSLSASNAQTNLILGSGFNNVVEVTVAGNALGKSFPPDYSIVSDTTIQFAMPMAQSIGQVRVVLQSFNGQQTAATLEVVLPEEPVLRLGDGNEEELFVTFFPFELRAGGTPDRLSIVWVSEFDGPTAFPGLFDLEIGGGLQDEVLFLDAIEINQNGWGYRVYDTTPIAPGKTVHFQLTEFDPKTGFVPLPTSNVASAFYVL